MNFPTTFPRHPNLRHGLQLGAAVVIAYLASAAAGLPEGFWAVMSALIVTRPDTGATLGAGWDRIRGTLLGTACGLAGVWLRHQGLGAPGAAALALAVVALLAFASAGVPILRSAPITALIVLSSGGIAQHSALQVAGLRVAEIAIGVAVGLAISVALPAARASRRFDAECAALLRRIADQVGESIGGAPRTAAQKEAAGRAMRAALRELVLLGESAARESRFGWPGRARAAGPTPWRIAQLVVRTSQDAAQLGRIHASAAASADDPIWGELRDAARAALEAAADTLARRTRPEFGALRAVAARVAERCAAALSPDDPALLLAGALHWLQDDLRTLARIALAPPAAA